MPRTKYGLFIYIMHLAAAFALGVLWPLYFIWGVSGIDFWHGILIYVCTAGAGIVATFIFVWAYIFDVSEIIIKVANKER